VAGAQIALMNPGGIRSDVDAGVITHGEAFGIQPFSNILMVRNFTGDQIDAILERQFRAPRVAGDPEPNVILQVSRGFSYQSDSTAPIGSRVSNITLNGAPLVGSTTYQVAMNNFLGFGGDGFGATITSGSIVKFGADDLVALEAFLALPANNPYDPATAGGPRITRVP
jgi:5'-nucleotidase